MLQKAGYKTCLGWQWTAYFDINSDGWNDMLPGYFYSIRTIHSNKGINQSSVQSYKGVPEAPVVCLKTACSLSCQKMRDPCWPAILSASWHRGQQQQQRGSLGPGPLKKRPRNSSANFLPFFFLALADPCWFRHRSLTISSI